MQVRPPQIRILARRLPVEREELSRICFSIKLLEQIEVHVS